MFTEKHHPPFIEPIELDDYLSRGWYRMGQTIFTTHFLYSEGNLHSAIWTRLPLKGYNFRKSLRKILNRSSKKFKYVVRPGILNAEKEALYQKYKATYSWFRSPTLEAYLMDGRTENVFNTKEVCIYDQDTLIAFSFFDIGYLSAASIIGVFDPAYTSNSLGFYTMLLEIEYCLQNQYEFYYPGYIVPGRPKFDYKKRIGRPEEVEFFSIKAGKWQKITALSESEIPINKICRKLALIHSDLTYNGIYSQLLYYPMEESYLLDFGEDYKLDAPIFLSCFNDEYQSPRYLVFYNLWRETYSLCIGMRYEDLAFQTGKTMQLEASISRHFLNNIFKKNTIIESIEKNDVVKEVLKIKNEITKRTS